MVVVSGSVNALIELGSVSALWSTGSRQVLLVKISLVALIAGASFLHALRLRRPCGPSDPEHAAVSDIEPALARLPICRGPQAGDLS
jgi:putative copper export protein